MGTPRACTRCHVIWRTGHPPNHWTPHWEPAHGGWWCGHCARTRHEHTQQLAAKLLRSPSQTWRNLPRNTEHTEFGECWHCDVLRQAHEWLAATENRPWAREQLRTLGIDHLTE